MTTLRDARLRRHLKRARRAAARLPKVRDSISFVSVASATTRIDALFPEGARLVVPRPPIALLVSSLLRQVPR